MGLTTNTVTIGKNTPKEYWAASVYSNDVDTTGNIQIKAAPSSGNLYLEHLIIFGDATGVSITVNDDATPILGPFLTTTAEMGHYTEFKFMRPIKLTNALKVDCGGNSPIFVFAEGFTG